MESPNVGKVVYSSGDSHFDKAVQVAREWVKKSRGAYFVSFGFWSKDYNGGQSNSNQVEFKENNLEIFDKIPDGDRLKSY